MAILNYADKLEYIKDWENKTDDLRIIFTGDGHIITHGVDFTADYTPGKRGLVPVCNKEGSSFLKSTGWDAITTDDLPITTNILTETNPNDTIPNTSAIKEFFNTTIQTAETLRFKGVIKAESNKVYYKNSDSNWIEGVPSAQMGDSYRVSSTDGSNICGYTVEAGDMLLCIANTKQNNESNSIYWTVIQANINGTQVISINGTALSLAAHNIAPEITLYAPTTKGDKGQILVSGGKDLVWGDLIISEGKLQIGNIISKDIIANSTIGSLQAGDGLSISTNSGTNSETDYYNGSDEMTITLGKASKDKLGGVKIGANISINENGEISLTENDVIGALGMNPKTVVSEENPGIVPKIADTENVINTGDLLLVSDEGTPCWKSLSADIFKNTIRQISISGKSIDENPKTAKAINFVPSGEIYLMADLKNDDICDIAWGLNWYHINSDGKGTFQYSYST